MSSEQYNRQRVRQSGWRYKTTYKGPKRAEELLESEFMELDLQNSRRQTRLRLMLQHARENVPFYSEHWKGLNLPAAQLVNDENWNQIPRLKKGDLISGYEKLKATHLLPGDVHRGFSKTSGTTGQPVKVDQSAVSRDMFVWLKQRELRWFDFDSSLSHLSIRPGEELAVNKKGERWPDTEVLQMPGWPYLHSIFETGPAFGFAGTNPVLEQVQVLEKLSPNYLLMEPATLENLAAQSISDDAKKQLEGVQAISQTLTSEMKTNIESALGADIQQNYGLNEVGLVASRCPEGGRYHVHEEHCYVEITDDHGVPVKPGERGTILVTSLSNSAMPLIRYDTEDSAIRRDDACICGRTLFSFADIEGRYRRLAQLPEGSYQRFKALQAAINQYARSHAGSVSQYQVYQKLGGEFQIMLDCHASAEADLSALVKQAFGSVKTESEPPGLTISFGRDFKGLEKRKFQIFYSEYMPDLGPSD